jgi:putative flippase GtrA
MMAALLARPFVRFLLVGGLAALVNIVARIAFNTVVPYEIAIVIAYLFGLSTGFILNRAFVFEGTGSVLGQYWRFTFINLVSLIQVWLISVGLARWGFPAIGFTWNAETVAHAIGVASPVITSYWAHRHFTFRRA